MIFSRCAGLSRLFSHFLLQNLAPLNFLSGIGPLQIWQRLPLISSARKI